MRAYWPIAAIVLLASEVEAGGRALTGYKFEVAGWTHDERYVVMRYTGLDDAGLFVVDARSGRPGTLVSEDAEDAWLRKHPLTKVQARRDSPDGAAKTNVLMIRAPGNAGEWKDGEWTAKSVPTAQLQVSREGRVWTELALPQALEKVEAFWSPSGRRVLWIGTGTWHGQGTSVWSYAVTPGGGPRIQMLANRAIWTQAVDKVAPLLEGAGFAPAWTGPAQDNRTDSIVYVADGFAEVGKSLAGKIPGGARVEPLSWKAPFDAVVALGSASLKGAP